MSDTEVVYDGTLKSALEIKNLAASDCTINADGELIVNGQKIKKGESWSQQGIRKDREDNTRPDQDQVRSSPV